MNRRKFMKGALAGAGVAAAGSRVGRAASNIALPSLKLEPPRARTPVKHIVVLMMENRSVNHFLGWYGAENAEFDAIQHASYVDLRKGADGPLVSTEPWGRNGRNNYHGRGFEDPSHGWDGGRAERAGGLCNGWLDPETGNDELCLATYDAIDVPVWAQVTRDYQAYDRWFCSVLGPTYPNRYYLHSAQSAGLKNNAIPPELASEHPEWSVGWDWPTIWTLCDAYGLSAGYYFCNLPVVALWGGRHLDRAHHISEFFAAAATGLLPQVSFVDPWFSAPGGIANDDHPLADIRLGEAFLSDVMEAFCTSPAYESGALVMTYDEWGGFWDHVDPPRLADDRATPNDPGGADDFGQIGFRVPSTIVSPWTRNPRQGQGRVDHTVYEHSSVLKFIADNWGLPYLTLRERMTNSIEAAFGGFTSFDPDPAFIPYEAPLHTYVEPTLEMLGIKTEDVTGPVGDVLGGVPIPVSRRKPSPSVPTSGGCDMYKLAESGFLDRLKVRTDYRFEDSYLRSRPELLAEAIAAL